MKFIFVTGGVLSGLGKGITSASIGLLLKARGIKVTIVKCDMYLNKDAGTMNPVEHGEVFVTDDGLETDQDLGNYERFLNTTLTKDNYLTNGLLYGIVLKKERELFYGGKCVQPYHHIPPEIIQRWKKAGKVTNSDVVIVEFGGTAGEYEGLLFFEAARRLHDKNRDDVCFVHIGYLPAPNSLGELKSKPTQQSISILNSLGIRADFIVCRAEKEIDIQRKKKIALAAGLDEDNIISNPDMSSIYEVPDVIESQSLPSKILKKLKMKTNKPNLTKWQAFVKKRLNIKKEILIGIVGKYQKTGDYVLEDAYVCVIEALKHAGWNNKIDPVLKWIDAETLEKLPKAKVAKVLHAFNGIIVPQGWGKRGYMGKLAAIEYARESNTPYLGLCYGMQMAAIEFARNVLGIKNAASEEIVPNSKNKIIHLMPNQKDNLIKRNYGGTIRLGSWPCKIKKATKLHSIYKTTSVGERHRHRYEFNNKYKKQFERKGMVFSGLSPDNKLVEAIELKDHPFFIGTQFHPEYKSRPLNPHPIFISFVKSASRVSG